MALNRYNPQLTGESSQVIQALPNNAINKIIQSKSPIQFGEYFRNVRLANPVPKMILNDLTDSTMQASEDISSFIDDKP